MIGVIGNHIFPNQNSHYLVKSIKESTINLQSAEIVTLGTSHNGAILANEIKMPLVHMYTGGQNIVESLYLLNYFKKRLKNTKIILLPLTIGSLDQATKLRSNITNNIFNLEPFNFFKYQTLDSFSFYLDGIFNLIARDDNWSGVIKKIIPMDFTKKKNKNPFLVERVLGHINQIDVNDRQHTENLNYLKSIIMSADSSNSCLVLYDSPVSFTFLERIKKYKPQLSNWRVPIRNMVQRNKSKYCLYFIENIWSEINSKNPMYYRDLDHLNETGAKIFTSMMDKELKKVSNKYGKH
jgi:hypothetical protein